ncbi:MAG: hypothetical protein N4A45_08825 [Flavobacteriales bacterium]|jgi:antitoxin component YwqK of YwqJK toxin-antitoxin module|nr:hypothetical protein [Flavobacteriales bacterium]
MQHWKFIFLGIFSLFLSTNFYGQVDTIFQKNKKFFAIKQVHGKDHFSLFQYKNIYKRSEKRRVNVLIGKEIHIQDSVFVEKYSVNGLHIQKFKNIKYFDKDFEEDTFSKIGWDSTYQLVDTEKKIEKLKYYPRADWATPMVEISFYRNEQPKLFKTRVGQMDIEIRYHKNGGAKKATFAVFDAWLSEYTISKNQKISTLQSYDYLNYKKDETIRFDSTETPIPTNNVEVKDGFPIQEMLVSFEKKYNFKLNVIESTDTLFSKSGFPLMIAKRKNGLFDESIQWFYPNGKLRVFSGVKNGVSHGMHFILNEKGDTLVNSRYQMGNPVYTRKHKDSKIRHTHFSTEGKEVFRMDLSLENIPIFYSNSQTKETIWYHTNGKIKRRKYRNPKNLSEKMEEHFTEDGVLIKK